MATSAELLLKIRSDIEGVKQDMSAVRKEAEATGKSFMGMGQGVKVGIGAFAGFAAAKLSVDALKGATIGLLKAGSDISESQNKVNVVFGQGVEVINKFAAAAPTALGISKKAALDAAGGFGNMFDQLGIASDKSADMSTNIMKLAADFGSFHNADITSVLDAQSAAFRGEYDSLQKFLPLVNAATVEQQAMEMTGKKNAAALTQQEKALAVYQLMLEGAGKAQGDFERTSDGAANAGRRIGAILETAGGQIGEKFLPMVEPLISKFADALPGAIDSTVKKLDITLETVKALSSGEGFDKLYDKMRTAFGDDVADKIAAVVDPLAHLRTEVLPKLIEKVQETIDKIKDFVKAIADNQLAVETIASVIGAFTTMQLARLVLALPGLITQIAASTVAFGAQAVAAGAAAIAVGLAALPFILLGVAITGLILIGIQVVKHWDELTQAAKNLKEKVGGFFEDLGRTVSRIMADISYWIDEVMRKIRDFLSKIPLIGGAFKTVTGESPPDYAGGAGGTSDKFMVQSARGRRLGESFKEWVLGPSGFHSGSGPSFSNMPSLPPMFNAKDLWDAKLAADARMFARDSAVTVDPFAHARALQQQQSMMRIAERAGRGRPTSPSEAFRRERLGFLNQVGGVLDISTKARPNTEGIVNKAVIRALQNANDTQLMMVQLLTDIRDGALTVSEVSRYSGGFAQRRGRLLAAFGGGATPD